jgi:predicted CXXCH cytochrome family protein
MRGVTFIQSVIAALFIAAFAAPPASAHGDLVPHPPKGKGEHCVADTEFMRRYHMTMMKHQRDETVHEGVRGNPYSIAACVDCHAVKGAGGQPVAYEDPKHFCRSCHDYAAVSIDCFECHASRPGAKSLAESSETGAAGSTALANYLQGSHP